MEEQPQGAREASTAIAVAEESNEPKIGKKDRLEELCVNTIRFLAVDAIEKAKSGHPGTPMGMADMAFVLWTEFLRHDPLDQDRKSTRLNSSHANISYAVFCLKKKNHYAVL